MGVCDSLLPRAQILFSCCLCVVQPFVILKVESPQRQAGDTGVIYAWLFGFFGVLLEIEAFPNPTE